MKIDLESFLLPVSRLLRASLERRNTDPPKDVRATLLPLSEQFHRTVDTVQRYERGELPLSAVVNEMIGVQSVSMECLSTPEIKRALIEQAPAIALEIADRYQKNVCLCGHTEAKHKDEGCTACVCRMYERSEGLH